MGFGTTMGPEMTPPFWAQGLVASGKALSGPFETISLTAVSTGLGVTVTGAAKGRFLIIAQTAVFMNNGAGNSPCIFFVYRNTGTIPTAGSDATVDTLLAQTSTVCPQILVGEKGMILYLDTSTVVGTAYNYYLAFASIDGNKVDAMGSSVGQDRCSIVVVEV